MKVSGRLWFDQGTGAVGTGRIGLLERIDELGSISQAAKSMGMSYKAAWDAVNAMNNLAEEPLVVRSTGGRHGGGTRLTEEGRQLIRRFRDIEREYLRFLEQASARIDNLEQVTRWVGRFSMKSSARNQFFGRVTRVKPGAVNAEVVVDIGGDELVAIITNESAGNLRLREGTEVQALIKASWVILTGGEPATTSARNRLCGEVVYCQEGAVNAEVVIALDGGKRLAAIITNESLSKLGLAEGVRACGLIKASHIILATGG